MENLFTSRRAASDKRRDFTQLVKKVQVQIVFALIGKKTGIRLSRVRFLVGKKSPIGIVSGMFFLYAGSEKIYPNRVAGFDFFPDARMIITIFLPKPNDCIICEVDLGTIVDIHPVIDSFLEMILSAHALKKKLAKKKKSKAAQ